MRVLVADDHSLFRDGIVSLLEASGFEVVGQAGDGEQAIQETRRLKPDIVLMDITMPHLSGLEALREIKTEFPDIHVVMLTVSDEDEDLLAAIKAGANGYLLKNLNASQFLEMINGLKEGEAALTRKTTARLIEGFRITNQEKQKPEPSLTTREIELLELVAEGLANKAIAQKLEISENTVKYHIRNILQKLNVQNRTEAVIHAIRVGVIKPHM
ncbi:MAG: response regulator transcription factor [Chloroflexota bacterium]